MRQPKNKHLNSEIPLHSDLGPRFRQSGSLSRTFLSLADRTELKKEIYQAMENLTSKNLFSKWSQMTSLPLLLLPASKAPFTVETYIYPRITRNSSDRILVLSSQVISSV